MSTLNTEPKRQDELRSPSRPAAPVARVKLDKSFFAQLPDELAFDVADVIAEREETLANWPEGAKLVLKVTGDYGAYCEPDTRSLISVFHCPFAGGERQVERELQWGGNKFKPALSKNIDEMTEFARRLERVEGLLEVGK